MSRNDIAVIGRTAQGTELLDGQTVKTKILYEELRRTFPDRKILCVDTWRYKKRAIPILWDTFRAFVSCGHIFVLLSRNGRTFFFPLITGLGKLFRRRLYHDVVGGALPGEAKERPALRRQLARFEVNWVELPQMKQELEALGLTNVEVLPNFKRLQILSPEDLRPTGKAPYTFTMFSRVCKTKGMTEAIEAVAAVNEGKDAPVARLKIYGPVEDAYRQEFETLCARHSRYVDYMGTIPQDRSVEALQDSFMLLFPSVYPGEGMPGTIIDAFSAGLPVIATDWHFNAQLVRNGETGYHYDWQKPALLKERIAYAMAHPDEVDAMRPGCLEEAKKYAPEAAMAQIRKKMDG